MPAARLALALLLALLASPSAASAAIVEMREEVETEGGRTYVYGDVVMTAAAGEANRVTVTYERGGSEVVVVRDASAPLTAGARCTNLDAHAVRCDGKGLSGITGVRAELGDVADTATFHGDANGPYAVLDGGAGDDGLAGRWVQLHGGDGNDVLRGDSGRETLDGGRGDDLLEGHGDIDYLDGGAGDDTLRGGDGHDHLLGGTAPEDPDPAGTDLLNGGPGHDTLDDQDGLGAYSPGPDALLGGAGIDTVSSYILRRNPVAVDLTRLDGQGEQGENDALSAVENAEGGRAADTLIGDGGPNRLDGHEGRDLLRGGGGDDHLISRVRPGTDRENAAARTYGPDRVFGDAGDDLVETLPALESEIACGDGRDRVVLEAFASDPAPSSLGPLVSRTCERLRMPAARRPVEIVPFPTAITRDSILFSSRASACCDRRMELQTVRRRPRRLAAAALRRGTMRLRVGRAFARAARSGRGATFRGKITRVAHNRFVWRVRTGRDAF